MTILCALASPGRSSHEERGLKCRVGEAACKLRRRSSHEERGLKCRIVSIQVYRRCRSSHEERGLKSGELLEGADLPESLLA